jgi:hypothetical protein
MIRRGKTDLYDEDGERIFPDREVNSVSVQMTHDERQFYRGVTDSSRTSTTARRSSTSPKSVSRWP